jgi:hypothetical protein
LRNSRGGKGGRGRRGKTRSGRDVYKTSRESLGESGETEVRLICRGLNCPDGDWLEELVPEVSIVLDIEAIHPTYVGRYMLYILS